VAQLLIPMMVCPSLYNLSNLAKGTAKNQHPSSSGVSGGSNFILDAAKGELSRV